MQETQKKQALPISKKTLIVLKQYHKSVCWNNLCPNWNLISFDSVKIKNSFEELPIEKCNDEK